jgi:hypothetical protein
MSHQVVTRDICKAGLIVIRNPKDWAHSNQDCDKNNVPVKGTIVNNIFEEGSDDDSLWVRVKWDNGHSNTYRIGNQYFDLLTEVDFEEKQIQDI